MATIKDVARLAGVGVGTVSRVMSGKGPVSAESEARVRAAIGELDYRPSHPARALAARTYGTIGVFVPDIGGSYYSEMLRVIDRELRACDRYMIAANGCGPSTAREQVLAAVNFVLQRGCDGLLLVSQEVLDEDFAALRDRVPHIATLNRVVPALEQGCFAVDHFRGGQIAAEALLARGHRKLAIISGPSQTADNCERLRGFHAVTRAAGIADETIACAEGDFSLEGGWAAADRLLVQGASFTGLFVANDDMAIAALSRFQSAGLQVPRDVSIVAYDDIKAGAFSSPPLTTVRIPFVELALNATNWLLNTCYDMARPVERHFEASLTLRESLAAVRSGK
jgi:LacI family transcriptional regulator